MKTKSGANKEHSSIIELLPMYVNSTIKATDRELVDTHLQSCSDCRKQLMFERKLQTATSAKIDVKQTARRNLAIFNSMLDGVQEQTYTDVARLKPRSIRTNRDDADTDNSVLIWQLRNFFGNLLPSSAGQFGGAIVMGVCALLVIGVFYKHDSPDTNVSGIQDSSNIVRGCETSEEVLQYEFVISPTSQTPVNVEAVEMLLNGAFTNSDYRVVDSDGSLLVTVNGTVCDKRIPKVTRSLEEQESIGKVLVRSLQ